MSTKSKTGTVEIVLEKSLFSKEAILLALHDELDERFIEITELDSSKWIIHLRSKARGPLETHFKERIMNTILEKQVKLQLQPGLQELRAKIIDAAFSPLYRK